MAKSYLLILLMFASCFAQAATTFTQYQFIESETHYIVTAILKKNGDDKDIKFLNTIEKARSEAEAIGLSFAKARGEYANYSVVETIATELQYTSKQTVHGYFEIIR